MKQLSGLDATFLYLETAQMPMHVGALHVFELPAGHKGRFVTALRQHIEQRLPLAPVLRRRLWWMPLNLANPAWVDAPPDLAKHIVEIKLPKAARLGDGRAELEAAVSRLHPVLLDRKRPLWKMHVLEGLAPGANGLHRVGLYTQLHHAAVDGQAAVALANVILDLSPELRALNIKPSLRPRTARLDMGQMLRGALSHQAQMVARIIKELPGTAGTLGTAARQALAGSKLLGGPGSANQLGLAPRTALNVSVSEGRAFAAVSWPLAELKALGRGHGATLNDMVLMLCSTALRRYFAARKALPKKSLIAAVPVSLRAPGDTSADTQASMSLISLGTHLADPAKRLAHIVAATASMKSTLGSVKGILPTDFPSIGVPWLMEALTALYGKAKVAERMPPLANVVISNVPGPAVPLYMAGARMLSNHPTSIVTHGVALNITVQSYNGALDVGLMADAAAMPDVRELAHGLLLALDDLRALPQPEPPAATGLARGALRQARKAVGAAVGAAMGAAVGAATDGLARAAVKRGAGSLGSLAGGVARSVVKSALGQPQRPATKPRRSKA